MRTLSELINLQEPAWPWVEKTFANAQTHIEVLPCSLSVGEQALLATQVTTRSPMGAIIYASAGVMFDHGWLRLLGAGGHPRMQRSLPDWNADRADGFLYIADDILGGCFAVNGDGLDAPAGQVLYWGPDTLEWEPVTDSYSDFLVWICSDGLSQFYSAFRWQGWELEIASVTADQAIFVYPFLFTVGPDIENRKRGVVPAAEQFALFRDLKNQLDGFSGQ